ncbi:putative Late nodulin [Medicago truncatula]|uniref:Nodule Cysteine-Rich (NCR) secreted peptide n=1 Tax=Medicago truncatula TaxID=3880 RepID=A7KHB4_MEDTR|nr:nodule-specific cysteine-rich peptide 187 [Medicago truncatula]AES88517.1 Nodule Cysteine-Rich (NCR) secreted peptide [Medicago truncatula]RHN60631.1 putative Late nodulin [Medicago truncatula]
MAHIIMFVYALIYALIIFSSLFVRDGIPCLSDDECPEMSHYSFKCNNKICEYDLGEMSDDDYYLEMSRE